MEENAQEATRKTKQSGKQHKYQHIPYQNQNFISISRKSIVPVMLFGLICLQTENKFAYVQIFL